jgi:signal transduction histidine kinase
MNCAPADRHQRLGETLVSDQVDREMRQRHAGHHQRTDAFPPWWRNLDFSVSKAAHAAHPERLDIVAELGDALLMFTERAKKENIALIYDEPDLIFAVYGDKNRVRQVFVNIIDNALKYSESGDTVTVTAVRKGDYIRIDIADTGCGINEKDLPFVKNKFFKSNYTKRGSGIGLAVADEIVLLHGGNLSLTSKEHKGTIVSIQLPSYQKTIEEQPPQLPGQ